MTAEQKQNVIKWLEALRSGRYEQGKGFLRSLDHKYCCFGVLCEILEIPCVRTETPNHRQQYSYMRMVGPPPAFALEKIGLTTGFYYHPMIAYELMGLNDEGAPFTVIANRIEEALLQQDTSNVA